MSGVGDDAPETGNEEAATKLTQDTVDELIGQFKPKAEPVKPAVLKSYHINDGDFQKLRAAAHTSHLSIAFQMAAGGAIGTLLPAALACLQLISKKQYPSDDMVSVLSAMNSSTANSAEKLATALTKMFEKQSDDVWWHVVTNSTPIFLFLVFVIVAFIMYLVGPKKDKKYSIDEILDKYENGA